LATNSNYIWQIFVQIKSRLVVTIAISAVISALIAVFVAQQDAKIETYSKIFPLSFSKSSSSPIDAIKAQFGIADKTDYSVIYNIKELVNSKTISTRIVQSSPSKKSKHRTIAEWLINDYNEHVPFYKKKIKIKPKDSTSVIFTGASLLLSNTEVMVEKSEFTKIITKTYDKELSKEINLAILSEISEFYIQVATEKPRTDLNKIQFIRDSLKLELGAIESAIAGFQDANQLSVKYSTGIPQAKLMRDRAEIEQLYATTATAFQNARFKLLSESPIFQILDYPGEPYNYVQSSWKVIGLISFMGLFMFISLFFCRDIFVNLIIHELSKP
jgi:hypothetical protein